MIPSQGFVLFVVCSRQRRQRNQVHHQQLDLVATVPYPRTSRRLYTTTVSETIASWDLLPHTTRHCQRQATT
jgi:hypothetical protein